MYDDEWNRFMRTGSVSDYLAYKGHLSTKDAAEGAGDIHECGYAGFRDNYGDSDKVRADRGI